MTERDSIIDELRLVHAGVRDAASTRKPPTSSGCAAILLADVRADLDRLIKAREADA